MEPVDCKLPVNYWNFVFFVLMAVDSGAYEFIERLDECAYWETRDRTKKIVQLAIFFSVEIMQDIWNIYGITLFMTPGSGECFSYSWVIMLMMILLGLLRIIISTIMVFQALKVAISGRLRRINAKKAGLRLMKSIRSFKY